MDGALPGVDSRTPLVVRQAREVDVDRLLEIHLAAFPDPRPIEVRRRLLLHNRMGGFEHLRVAELAGDLVAHAFAFPVEAWFGGRLVRGSAIASLGVASDARGQGVARALLAALHDEGRQRGGAFSLLYPFRQGFYARLGYTQVSPHRVLTLCPRAIPRGWIDAAPGTVRRVRSGDHLGIAAVYGEAGRVGAGFLRRPDRAWELDLLDERRQWLVLDCGGTISGYVSFTIHQSEPHGRVRGQVHELVSPSSAGRRRLFAVLRSLADQVAEVTVAMACDDLLDWAFVDGDPDRAATEDVEHPLGVVSAGPMIRLLDVDVALLARGYASDGAVNLAVGGEPPFRLEVVGGRAQISRNLDSASIRMTSEALAAVALGGLGVEEAAQLGWAHADDEAALRTAARVFATPRFFSLDHF